MIRNIRYVNILSQRKSLIVLLDVHFLIEISIKPMKINCPKCHKETEFFTHTSISEDGEVYKCQHCGWPFRYVFDYVKKSK